MIIHKIMEFGKDEVSPHYLLEADVSYPNDILKVKYERNFREYSNDDMKFPIEVEVIGNDKLNESLQNTFDIKPRRFGTRYQMGVGYILVAYNMEREDYDIIRRLWYTSSIPSRDFNNNNYVYKNPLDNLEHDVNDYINGGEFDFLFVFIFGDKLDYFNTNKVVINEGNQSQERHIPISDEDKFSPMKFLNDMGSSLKLDILFRDTTKNSLPGNIILSNPIEKYLTYFGKICLRNSKVVEDVYTFDRRFRPNGEFDFFSTLNAGDSRLDDNSLDPYINNYEKSKSEEHYDKQNNCKVLYGFDYHTPINIFDTELKLVEPERKKIDVRGREMTFTCLFQSKGIHEEEKFVVRDGITTTEIKKADQ